MLSLYLINEKEREKHDICAFMAYNIKILSNSGMFDNGPSKDMD